MALEDRVIITAALTGMAADRAQCPAIPYTPQEIAQEARRARDAGATVMHIHAREDGGAPSFRKERYAEIRDAVREACQGEVILNFSTGAIGIPMEDRVAHIRDLGPEIGALNMGSMNYAKYSYKNKTFYFDFVFQNPFKDITFLLKEMRKGNVKPELECFDMGHIGNIRPLLHEDLLKPPIQFSLILGVLGGIEPTIANLVHMAGRVPSGSTWEVIGISRHQWPLVGGALAMGGNVRVGLEDNFYLPNGEMAKSNGELVAKAAQMTRDVGRQVASYQEAYELLSLGDPWGQGPAGVMND